MCQLQTIFSIFPRYTIKDDLAFPSGYRSPYEAADCRNHCNRDLESDLALRISLSSCKQYFPKWRHSRNIVLSMTFVSESATWAAEGTQRIWIPLFRCSFISLAWSKVRNSPQLGGAVRLIKSYKDLQSVVIMALLFCGSCFNSSNVFSGHEGTSASGSIGGMAANAGGNCSNVWSAFFQGRFTFMIQPQYKRTQDSISTVPASDIASAESVLTATFWIFLECQTNRFTGLVRLFPMFSWHDMIIIPWWESGSLFEEKEASENATNRNFAIGIGWTLIVTSAWSFASWSVRLASSNVDTCALLIRDCNHPRRLQRSGRLLTAAYCNDPMRARNSCLSESVTGSSGLLLLSRETVMWWISLIYCVWWIWIDWSGCWSILRPVKVKFLRLCDPKENFSDNCRSFSWKTSEPQHKPSSTWMPTSPSGVPDFSFGSTKTHGSNGEGKNPRFSSPFFSSMNHK